MCSLFIWLSRLHPTPNLMVTAGLSRAGCSAQRLWFTDGCRMVFQEDSQN